MMNAQQVIDFIHGARYTGDKQGLRNTSALLDQLNIPQTPVPAIHVAGTNGKGSVCVMLFSVLKAGGYRVGLYTSPFLCKFNERINLDGKDITDGQLGKYGTRVIEAAQTLQARGISPTSFELGTALAYTAFYEEKVDIAVIEVGLGGRLDPTNVITPLVSVITTIGLDHTQFLGDTLEAIAGEKAGIIKPHVPVVVSPNPVGVQAVIRDRANALEAPCLCLTGAEVTCEKADRYGSHLDLGFGDESFKNIYTPLPGEHQHMNALTAVAALRALTFKVSEEAVYEGLRKVSWPARLQWQGNVLVDGAHNAQGAKALKNYVDQYMQDEQKVLLTGMMADKANDEMIEALSGIGQNIITVTLKAPRSLTAQALVEKFSAKGCQAVAADSVAGGFKLARQWAEPSGVVVVAGSLYLAGEIQAEI